METLSERVQKCLVDGRTQAGLAKACNIKPPSISAWMSGKTKKIEGANLLRAATYLGCNPEWLATGMGPRTSSAHNLPTIAPPTRSQHTRPAVQQIIDACENVSDAGLAHALGYVTCLAQTHPVKRPAADTAKSA
jgi:transcriptional regulator with XRE-family HTH domain